MQNTPADLANREPPHATLFFVPLAANAPATYDDPIMQSIDDGTHFLEGAVLELHSDRIDGLEPQIRRILSDIDPNITLLNVQTLQPCESIPTWISSEPLHS